MDFASTNLLLAHLAREHHGLIRHDLAIAGGVSPNALARRHRTNIIETAGPGVSRLAGTPDTWHQRALLAVWTVGPQALLSHRAAAMLWKLDGIETGPLEVLTDRWMRKTTIRDLKIHEAQDIAPSDRTTIDSIPCTSIVRVLLDLPSVVSVYRADQAFEDALRRRLCTVEQVADRFVQVARRGRPGTVIGRRLIQKRSDGYIPTHSEFERRVSDLLTTIGLPRPIHQHRVALHGGRSAYLDLAYPDRMLGIECDGVFYHADNVRLPWDDGRQNDLVLAGWRIIRLTWEQLTAHRAVLVRQLKEAYRAGNPTKSPNLR